MQRSLLNLDEIAEYDVRVPTVVKWAGGKQSLIEQYIPFLPKKIDSYYEPFLGGASFLLFIIKNKLANKYIANDINKDLILTYIVIRDNLEELLQELKQLKRNHSEEQYYKVRGLKTRKTSSLNIDDEDLVDKEELTNVERAARFVYLNKTCFNGLYRENSNGEFNVPMGSYKNPGIYHEKVFKKAAKLFKKVSLNCGQYKEITEQATKQDLIYFDPPYAPLNPTSDFTKYSKDDFNLENQQELARLFKKLDRKGVNLMLSNSSSQVMLDLYEDYNIHMIDAKRSINSNGKGRDEVKEILVTNY